MNRVNVLLVFALYIGAARGALEGGCGRAGALSCDADGRHLLACTKGGAWRRVLDCGAAPAACVNGRCEPGASARVETCSTPGQWGCSKDCTYRTICTTTNVWVDVSPCPAGYICDGGACVDAATNYCGSSNTPICGKGSQDRFFPNMIECANVLYCAREGSRAADIELCSGDPNTYFNPCIRTCGSSSTICDRYESCNGNDGVDAVIPGNPTLHYICANGTMFLMKCESPTSYYDPYFGDCLEIGFEICP